MNEWNNYCGWEDSRCILLKLHSSPVTARSLKVWPLLIYSHSCVQIYLIRSQLETVIDFWLVNVCMKEYELTEGGHTFGLLAVSVSLDISIWRFSWQPLSVHSWAYCNPGRRGTQKSFIQGGSTFEDQHCNSLLFYTPILTEKVSLSKW